MAVERDTIAGVTVKRQRRRYTDAEKAAALTLMDFESNTDAPLTIASRALQIPDSTLHNWYKGRGVRAGVIQLGEQKKRDIAELCEQYARSELESLLPRAGQCDPAKTMTAVGIAIDKMLVLRGRPTQITESRTISATLRIEAEATLAELVQLCGGDREQALIELQQYCPTLAGALPDAAEGEAVTAEPELVAAGR